MHLQQVCSRDNLGTCTAFQGDALYAFELALSLEKLNYHKLMELVKVAESTGDNQMTDFVGTS